MATGQLNRRDFTKFALGATAGLMAGGMLPRELLASPSARRAAGSKPNIILIFTDDQGYHDLGVQGHPTIRTPHIDGMAKEGVRFTDFYVAASICVPSRRAMMTGCYAQRCGINSGKKNGPDERTILPEVLKTAGYASALIGKWHLGSNARQFPTANGFDYFYGTLVSNNDTTELYRNDKVIEDPYDNDLLTRQHTEEALQFIEKNKRNPFFLYLAHNAPHWPVGASKEFKGKSKFGRPYGDSVEELDWSVGQVLAKLKALGIDDNTLVIYTSDNGARGQDGGSGAPFKGGKWSHYDGGQRVPCVMRWPKHMPKGVVCDELSSTMDFVPTFATLAGQKAPTDRIIDGYDITPLLTDPAKADTPWPVFFYYGSTSKVPLAARSGPWKYDYKAKNLVKINEDPQEKNNLAAGNPNLVKQFETLRDEINKSVQAKKNQTPPRLAPVKG